MSVAINLPPEVEARVAKEAARRCLPVEAFLTELVTGAVFSRVDKEHSEQRERSLALLRSVWELGDEAEQRETFSYLKKAVNQDRLSSRKRFA